MKRLRAISISAGMVAVATLILFVLAHQRRKGSPSPEAISAGSELFLPSSAPQGNWGNPAEGARWEEEQRAIGLELSRRKESGPVRCSLRIRLGIAAREKPEVEVRLRNVSDDAVALRIHGHLLDTVTFIFRDPDGKVVSSFSTVYLHSTLRTEPPMILGPGESKASEIFLSVACGRGFRPLRPGLYSIQAVFPNNSVIGPPGLERTMLARSNRISVRVGKP
jgi:hypothetical protein